MTKLIIKGEAGQGVQLLGFVLSNVLTELGYKIALTSQYTPLMRSGGSSIYLVFSKEPIGNPLIDEADIEYNMENEKLQKEILARYENKQTMNMTLLGMILKKLNLKISAEKIKAYLPVKFLEENLKAIKQGLQ